MKTEEARKLYGSNFLGFDELMSVAHQMKVRPPATAFDIQFSDRQLREQAGNCLLVHPAFEMADGAALTLNALRGHFGCDPSVSEPCFYNQDWYLKEEFARTKVLEPRWYLVQKELIPESRGVAVDVYTQKMVAPQKLPTAVLTAFVFFFYYFARQGALLWEHDFLWCADTDSNGDRIYTGRYHAQNGLAKAGFNVHRHLTIRPFYGIAPEIG